ncbi:MAG: ATP-binding protein [Coriobacteriales bacterium]
MAQNQTLSPSGYRPRLIEERLDALLASFGCVEITGPKWCGKTWTAMTRAASMTRLDDPSQRAAAELDPSLALVGDTPHLVDEWQEVPEVWDAARRFVDSSGNKRGSLLLTGSTSLAKDERSKVRHSGTGRIARLSMRPMALCELGESSAQVSLRALLEGEPCPPAASATGLEDVARWCCRGGWPANLGLSDVAAAETALQYIQSVLDVNVIDERRSPTTALALLRALALNESQAVTYKTLAKDMGGGGSEPDADTLAAYIELFSRLKLTEDLLGWEPPMRSKARVRVKPKRFFCDPSLAAALLGATPQRLLCDAQTLGMLFENLVLRDLRVFLSTYAGLGNGVFYYRDEAGLEVDVIIEYAGRWAAIEVKLSDSKADDGAKSLLALRRKLLANPAARNAEPAFLAVVVGRGSMAYMRNDGVMVIPAATLTA